MTGTTMPATLEDLLSGTRSEGQEKTASAASRPVGQEEADYAAELLMLEKYAQDTFTQDDMLKIAASAKISGDIISDIQVEKLAKVMPVLIKVALDHLLPGALQAALNKVAVGESKVISGGKPADTVEDPPHDQTQAEADKDNEGGAAKVDSLTHANETVGASGDGSQEPESRQGKPTENTHGNTVGKMAQINPDQLAAVISQRLAASGGLAGDLGGNITSIEGEVKKAMGDMMPGYGMGDPGGGAPGGGGGEMDPAAMLEQLLAKQAQGQPLSPEEQQILQQLMAGGGGGGMPGGGMPGGEGMVREASVQNMTPAQKASAFEQLLRNRLG